MSNLHDNQQSLDSYYYQQPSAPYYNQQNQQIVIVRESQALPAIMALFFGGIGQLIQGRAAAGLLWLFNEILLGGILLFLTVGISFFLTVPLNRILCIIDAANYNPQAGKEIRGTLIAGLCINVAGILLAFLLWGIASSDIQQRIEQKQQKKENGKVELKVIPITTSSFSHEHRSEFLELSRWLQH